MLSRHLVLGSRCTFVGGKGGVGKTTVAAALAVELAEAGERVVVVSVDPAHSLGDALGVELGPEPRRVSAIATGSLQALEVDARHEQERFLTLHGATLATVIERGTYLDASDIEGVTGLTLPGIDELAAILRLAALARDGRDRIIVDTAPTGHAARMIELPGLAITWLAALDAMNEKHMAVAAAFRGAVTYDEASHFLTALRSDLAALTALFSDADATRFVLVATPEAAVLAETARFRVWLEGRGISLAGLVMNRASGRVDGRLDVRPTVLVPTQTGSPVGLDGLRRYSASAAPRLIRPLVAEGEVEAVRPRLGGAFTPPLDRSLYLIGGKGGVGKSTSAAAIGALLAAEGRRVLLLSVDPAGSLADLLEVPVGGVAVPVPGLEGLDARQLDAEAAWSTFRDRYRGEVTALFERLFAGGLSAAHDQRVIERLIDLAPPGIDELVAILEVIDMTEDRAYDALVVDTAPTGHLLRLLEMPAVALEWCHALMRLLLRYRHAVPLGEVAEEVLQLTRRIRRLQARLADGTRSWTLVVALPESLSVPETRRLLERLPGVGIEPGALLVNRALDEAGRVRPEASGRLAELLAVAPRLPAAVGPDLADPPLGSKRLLHFVRGWKAIAGEGTNRVE